MTLERLPLEYRQSVDYAALDPVKRKVLEKASSTFHHPERFGIRYRPESLGEAAAVFDFLNQDFMIAFIVETLGTKIMVADSIYGKAEVARQFTGKPLYRVGHDLIGMIVYDINNVGAQAVGVGDILSAGNANYFKDEERTEQLLDGLVTGANLAKATLAAGDTPALPDVINPQSLDMTGGGFGIIRPKSRFTAGGVKIQPDDVIYGFPSSGEHSNGYSLTRRIAEKLPEGYATKLPSGRMFGEALLVPTAIYSQLLEDLFESGVDVRFISHITGHGWEKVARAKRELTYEIEFLPEPQEELQFQMEHGPVTQREAYHTWNMGVGLTIIASASEASKIRQISQKHVGNVWELGSVKEGSRQVIMPFSENGEQVIYTP